MNKKAMALITAAVAVLSSVPAPVYAADTGVVLEWSAVSDADGYYVYRVRSGKSKLIGRVKDDTCCYVTDKVKYRYEAAPYYINGDGTQSIGNKFSIYPSRSSSQSHSDITVLPVKKEPEVIDENTEVVYTPPTPVISFTEEEKAEDEPVFEDDLIDDSNEAEEVYVSGYSGRFAPSAPAVNRTRSGTAEAAVSRAGSGKTAGSAAETSVTKAAPQKKVTESKPLPSVPAAPVNTAPTAKPAGTDNSSAAKKNTAKKTAKQPEASKAQKNDKSSADKKTESKKAETPAVKKTLVYNGIMKTSPKWSSKTVCTAPKNSKVTVEGESGNFYLCNYNGKRGYVYKRAVDGGKALPVKQATEQNLDLYLDDIIFSIGGGSNAIYNYVHSMKYNAARTDNRVKGVDSLKSNCRSLAASMIKNQSGMCYHYAALSQLLLERAGYNVKPVYCPYADGGFHCYNIIESNGKQQYFDACRFAVNNDIGYLPDRGTYMKKRGLDGSREQIG